MSFKQAFLLFPQSFKRLWPWLVFSQGLGVITSLMAEGVRSGPEKNTLVMVLVIVVIQLALSLFGMVIVNQVLYDLEQGRQKSEIMRSLRENFKYIFINYARSLVRILLGGIVFVIPGFIFWVQLTFVPYIVLFDPEFKAGQVDALAKSKTLVKGCFWRLTGILILCLVLSIVPEFWLGAIKPLESPVSFVLLFVVGMIFDLYGDAVIFCFYRQKGNYVDSFSS